MKVVHQLDTELQEHYSSIVRKLANAFFEEEENLIQALEQIEAILQKPEQKIANPNLRTLRDLMNSDKTRELVRPILNEIYERKKLLAPYFQYQRDLIAGAIEYLMGSNYLKNNAIKTRLASAANTLFSVMLKAQQAPRVKALKALEICEQTNLIDLAQDGVFNEEMQKLILDFLNISKEICAFCRTTKLEDYRLQRAILGMQIVILEKLDTRYKLPAKVEFIKNSLRKGYEALQDTLTSLPDEVASEHKNTLFRISGLIAAQVLIRTDFLTSNLLKQHVLPNLSQEDMARLSGTCHFFKKAIDESGKRRTPNFQRHIIASIRVFGDEKSGKTQLIAHQCGKNFRDGYQKTTGYAFWIQNLQFDRPKLKVIQLGWCEKGCTDEFGGLGGSGIRMSNEGKIFHGTNGYIRNYHHGVSHLLLTFALDEAERRSFCTQEILDQISISKPDTWVRHREAKIILVVTKADLISEKPTPQQEEFLQLLKDISDQFNYPLFITSAKTGEGMKQLREHLISTSDPVKERSLGVLDPREYNFRV